MTRSLAALLAALALSTPASAFWIDGFFDHVQHGYRANRQWPSPYICQDRVYAHQPFDAMVQNGWRRQNLLGSHHFTSDATKLTESGRLKVQWILTQPPANHRQIFVERSLEPSVTQQRVQTAQQFAAEVAVNSGDLKTNPQVTETHIVSEGRPAATVDYVNNQFRQNMPVPALPASSLGETE